MQRSSKLFHEAKNHIPGGVNSPVRAFNSVGGTPIFIKRAKGAMLYDEDNKSYIDYINSWGPMIIGHAHEQVICKIQEKIKLGISFGTPTEIETEIAKLITSKVKNIDLIRFVNSGTEACMSAIRLARGYTQKDKIIKFSGCYHGHSDSFLIQAGSGAATFGTPNSPGVTQGVAKDTLLAEFNDFESVQRLFDQNPSEIAAIILEPIAGNMGCIPPNENFLSQLREICDKHNAILIFDEVMTGFRMAFGGAQEIYNIDADLCCYGKVIGGGMPVGAFGGKKEIMNHLAPIGPVYQAGTLSGNPIAMAAGLETLSILTENSIIYKNIGKSTEILDTEISKILISKGIPFSTNRVGSMFSVFFTKEKVRDFKTASLGNNEVFKKFFHHALNSEIYLPPSSFETWFISNEIGDDEIEKTLEMVKTFNP